MKALAKAALLAAAVVVGGCDPGRPVLTMPADDVTAPIGETAASAGILLAQDVGTRLAASIPASPLKDELLAAVARLEGSLERRNHVEAVAALTRVELAIARLEPADPYNADLAAMLLGVKGIEDAINARAPNDR